MLRKFRQDQTLLWFLPESHPASRLLGDKPSRAKARTGLCLALIFAAGDHPACLLGELRKAPAGAPDTIAALPADSPQGDRSLRDDPGRRAIHPRNETSNGLFPVTDHPAEVLQKPHYTGTAENSTAVPPQAAESHPICREEQSFAAGQGDPSRSRHAGRCRGVFPHTTKRNSVTWSQFRRITGGKTARYRPSTDNTLRQRRARVRVVHHSYVVPKYELGKETERDGFGLRGIHLFLRSIYLFIN